LILVLHCVATVLLKAKELHQSRTKMGNQAHNEVKNGLNKTEE